MNDVYYNNMYCMAKSFIIIISPSQSLIINHYICRQTYNNKETILTFDFLTIFCKIAAV